MKITRRQLKQIIKEERSKLLSESVTSEAARIGKELNNIPNQAMRAVGGDFSKLNDAVNKAQEKIFVDIFLSYMDQNLAKLDQRYGLSPDQEHDVADNAKARYQDMLKNMEGISTEIGEAIKPFMRLLGKYSEHIEMG
tara:strand:+ start:73 stop:486 length:414 start_codon:yes stop_codon:yes gene_type:complete